MQLINRKYKLYEKIGQGCFGKVFKGENIRTKEAVAIKIEPISDNGAFLLKNETIFYEYLKGNDFVPKIKWFGKDETNYFMVMEYLNNPLPSLKNNFSHDSYFNIIKQLFLILESIHNKGLVHRDIKPDNFLMREDKIIIIDFGFCKSYLKDDIHNDMNENEHFIGSMDYASLNIHNHKTYSRRDDLESVCYLLYFILNGALPWNGKTESEIINMKEHFHEISNCKKLTMLWKKIRSLTFKETPNYHLLSHIVNIELV